VKQALQELSEQVDVILLAQASMARVVSQMSESDRKEPILSSPGIAVDHVAGLCQTSYRYKLRRYGQMETIQFILSSNCFCNRQYRTFRRCISLLPPGIVGRKYFRGIGF